MTSNSGRAERLAVALQALHRYFRSGLLVDDRRPLTRVQWMILRLAAADPPPTVGMLATRLDVRPSTMSQMLDRLEKEGWVQRTAAAGDSRVRRVVPTSEGRALLERLNARALARLEVPLAQLGEEEQERLLALLETLVAAIRPQREEARP
ncbi:protein of unknown function [Candidatus Hydrogenisulfobacillus filiaventi]|uniref:HTH marR-type domain-containing protein n=1 Tax=Candidatus Hydrogenisulfobacillus filiaventi TaxID=2707344 RepID=A0A6F8ZFR5_9FIRM|nr:MarR family transcriptional regulator [Bacillota bacterium]CAB1128829.1 protein of unknown function [Candidatus Hydrogenisulfobacillus filiaventi]